MRPEKVEIEIDVEYDVGSPPDDTVEPYQITEERVFEHEAIWMVNDEQGLESTPQAGGGIVDGVLTAGTVGLYPPWTDESRRRLLCLLHFSQGTLQWPHKEEGVTTETVIYLGNLWLTTDNMVDLDNMPLELLTDPGEGRWFALEGEEQADYRVWKKGAVEEISLT